MTIRRRTLLGALTALVAASVPQGAALAEEGRIRLVEQFGTIYLPLHVIRDQKLIEKHGKERGIDIAVEWTRLSGGAAINDAVLSGAVDIGAAGIPPILTLWDRSRGAVKIIAALGEQANYLITNNPDVKSIRDFTDKDKIALPAVGVSLQSRVLQLAAEKEFGKGKHGALDHITVTLPHPDATAALLSGSQSITAHFSNPPFQERVLAEGKAHRVLSSYDVLGTRFTGTLLYARTQFRDKSPKTYQALLAAIKEAGEWITANPKEAAATYIRAENSKLDPAFIEKVITHEDVRFTPTPQGTFAFAEFLHRVGAIKTKPESWKDYVFDDIHDQPGS